MHRMSVTLTALVLACIAAPLRADTTQMAFMRLHASTTIAAPPAAVWACATHGTSLVTWCPMWKNAANAKRELAKVGDVLDFTDEWGNGGRSVVTYLAAQKELRVVHEPTKGDYVCQAKIVLTPVAGGTKVDYWDQYSDASPEADRHATAGKMEKSGETMLAALKAAAEKH